jgi:ribosomal protein S12 methylthiotransferase
VAGAAANALPGAVPEEVKEERWHRLMAAQNAISADIMAGRIGRRIAVLVDDRDPETGGAIGRSPWDAPEIDGKVFLPDERGLEPGDLVEAEVYDADDYDLVARCTSRARKSPRTALPR